MAHNHPHNHGSAGANARRLAATLALVLVYMGVEVVGGLLAESLALIADAGHMFSDAGALALTLLAMRFARRPATTQRTYASYRAEILAALVNGATLVAVAIYIFIEACERIRTPPEVQGGVMLAVASGGLLVNAAGLWILRTGNDSNLNMRGAWLHVLTDALGSLQAIVAGALIWAFGWYWVDPVASVLIGLLVIYSSWSFIRQSVAVLMEGAPGHINVDDVRPRFSSSRTFRTFTTSMSGRSQVVLSRYLPMSRAPTTITIRCGATPGRCSRRGSASVTPRAKSIAIRHVKGRTIHPSRHDSTDCAPAARRCTRRFQRRPNSAGCGAAGARSQRPSRSA